jgi:hypothetical protein
MTNSTYCGWANYETWLVKLWIDNDQGVYELVNDWASSILTATEDPEIQLMETLKEWIEEESSEYTPTFGLYSDLLNAAIQNVDWYELAQSYLEELN